MVFFCLKNSMKKLQEITRLLLQTRNSFTAIAPQINNHCLNSSTLISFHVHVFFAVFDCEIDLFFYFFSTQPQTTVSVSVCVCAGTNLKCELWTGKLHSTWLWPHAVGSYQRCIIFIHSIIHSASIHQQLVLGFHFTFVFCLPRRAFNSVRVICNQ